MTTLCRPASKLFARVLFLGLPLLAPAGCASAPPASVSTSTPTPGTPVANDDVVDQPCPSDAVAGNACAEENRRCFEPAGSNLTCATGRWVVTPPCCKK